jgi:SAM-dependent methyltransferase
MQNEQSWKATKFVTVGTVLRASPDPTMVAASSRLMTERVASFFTRVIPEYATGRLLDLGCGSSPLYGLYKDYVSQVTCVDWGGSPHSTGHVDIFHDLNDPLPFEDNSFDTIILSDVLEHIQEPNQLFREMSRVLTPGGRLLLNVPFFYWLHERPFDFYRYTEFALRRFAERSDLAVIEISPLGGVPEIIADILSKSLIGSRFGNRAAGVIQGMAGRLVATRWGERFSRRTAERFPFAYAMVAQRV